MSLPPTVLIYRHELLLPSETFILAQGEAMKTFQPLYVGLKRVSGLQLPEDRSIALADGRLGRLKGIKFKLTGSPKHDVIKLLSMRPRLLHAHFGMDATDAMHLAPKLGVPFMVTFHGWDATVREQVFRRQSPMLNLYVRRLPQLNKNAARVICVSQFIRQKMIDKKFSPDRTIVHYIGIDRNKFFPNPSIGREPIVLFVGRLVKVKGAEYLLQAMRAVQSILPRAKVVIVGDGELRDQLEFEAARTLGCFSFLGMCSPQVVRDWMNRASVLCVPSCSIQQGNTEAFGMVFAEAQAMGLPVVSFASGGIPEAVEHGVTGLLAPERDVDALASNILMLLTNRSLWERFSHAGRDRVARLFDLQKQTAKLEQIYSQVLEEHQSKHTYAFAN